MAAPAPELEKRSTDADEPTHLVCACQTTDDGHAKSLPIVTACGLKLYEAEPDRQGRPCRVCLEAYAHMGCPSCHGPLHE